MAWTPQKLTRAEAIKMVEYTPDTMPIMRHRAKSFMEPVVNM
jgi:hypothetical protein